MEATLTDSRPLLQTLADFRYELRQFLQFSESGAQSLGLQPQQHQLLLQIAGAPEDALPTIAYAASRLGLRHNSVVELVDRSEREELLQRSEDAADRRRVLLKLTRKGTRLLMRLTDQHATEINDLAPRLACALERIAANRRSANAPPRRDSK